jgi:hypothetical protein
VLAFPDDKAEGPEPKFGTVRTPYTVEEYISRAKEVLKSRPTLRKLEEMIDKKEAFPV